MCYLEKYLTIRNRSFIKHFISNTESLHQEFTVQFTKVAKLELKSNTTNFIFKDHHNIKNSIKESQH